MHEMGFGEMRRRFKANKGKRPPIDDFPGMKYLVEHKGLVISSWVFSVVTLFLIFFGHTLGELLLGFATSFVALILEVVNIVGRRRVLPMSTANIVLQIAVRLFIVFWFAWTFVEGVVYVLHQR
jgi:hypothetical protein